MLETNDSRLNEFPISITGKVEEAISISPSIIDVADIQKGSTVNKRIIVKGSEPFQIVSYKASDDRLKMKISDTKRKLHIIPVTMEAGDSSGKINASIEIVTDLGGVKKKIDFSGTVID